MLLLKSRVVRVALFPNPVGMVDRRLHEARVRVWIFSNPMTWVGMVPLKDPWRVMEVAEFIFPNWVGMVPVRLGLPIFMVPIDFRFPNSVGMVPVIPGIFCSIKVTILVINPNSVGRVPVSLVPPIFRKFTTFMSANSLGMVPLTLVAPTVKVTTAVKLAKFVGIGPYIPEFVVYRNVVNAVRFPRYGEIVPTTCLF